MLRVCIGLCQSASVEICSFRNKNKKIEVHPNQLHELEFLEKLTGLQAVKKFTASYEI